MARPRYPEINRDEMREARLRLGLSYVQLQERCAELGDRIDSTLLSGYERGRIRPDPNRRLPVIAKALGLAKDDLAVAKVAA